MGRRKADGERRRVAGESMTPKEARGRADFRLSGISALKIRKEALEAALNAELEAVQVRYEQPIAEAREALARSEADLECFAKLNSDALFAGKDRIDLKRGALLLTVEKRVKRVKKMLAARPKE